MPELTSLPPELLGVIIINVEKSGWLLSLSLSCQYLNDLTLPLLYSSIRFTDAQCLHKYLRPLVLRMSNDPTLASHVRDLTVTESWEAKVYGRMVRRQSEDLKTLRWLFPTRIKSLDQIRSKAKDLILSSGLSHDILLALLLFALQNLQRLELFVPDRAVSCYHRTIDILSGQRKPHNIYPALASLRVMVHNCDSDGTPRSDHLDPTTFLAYLRLPNLREFYGQALRSWTHDGNGSGARNIQALGKLRFAQLEPASLSLTHLEIRHSSLWLGDLTNILQACRHLRTLVYGFDRPFNVNKVCEALAWTKPTLEELWLDYERPWNLGEQDTSGSFAELTNLKHVHMGMSLFFGAVISGPRTSPGIQATSWKGKENVNLASLLPASLETIHFSHTDYRVKVLIKALEMWLMQKDTSTPKLQRITFDIYQTEDEDEEVVDLSSLERLAANNGVTMEKQVIPADTCWC